MPLSWTISHPQRLLIAVAKGEVAPHEFGTSSHPPDSVWRALVSIVTRTSVCAAIR